MFKDLLGKKIESKDKDGYFIMQFCGYVVKISVNGNDAIIQSYNGMHYSTIGQNVISTVKVLP